MKKESISELLDRIREPENRFKPVAFWFLNHHPEAEEIRRQIGEMADKGFGGIMLHARNGLRGGYLNTHWEQAVRSSIDEARRLGLDVFLYDELNYPSGPAGGLLFDVCPDTAMQYLELVWEHEAAPGERVEAPGPPILVLVAHPEGAVETIGAPWTNPTPYPVKVLGFAVQAVKEYPDYLDADAMRAFVQISYQWYAERFKADMGSVVKGEFTDNACANFGFIRRSIPWTPDLARRFREKTGRELVDVLPSLFLETPGATRDRIVFWGFFNDLFLDTFIKPIEQVCAANGLAATGHYCIETGSSEHVRQLGDRFEQKRHQHIPGVDMLGAEDFEKLDELLHGTAMPLAIPMTASPAYFMHDSRVLCECFGLSAGWGMTLAEMRRIGGLLCALGADMHVPHGIYYSIAGHRKRECVPDFMHNTMWEHFREWSIWTGRICTLIARSEHVAETALFYPVLAQQASLELGVPGPRGDHGARCARIDAASRAAAECLVADGIPFEMIDESILATAEVAAGELMIPRPDGSRHVLRTLILPSAWIVRAATWAVLRRFRDGGGVVIALNDKLACVFDGEKLLDISIGEAFHAREYAVETADDLVRSDFKSVVLGNQRRAQLRVDHPAGKLVVREWVREGRRFAMVHNTARSRIEQAKIQCRFDALPVALDVDCVVARSLPWRRSAGDYALTRDFEGGETLILTTADSDAGCAMEESTVQRVGDEIDLQEGEWRIELEGPNTLRLPEWRVSHAGGLWLAEFEIRDRPERLGLALDLEPTDAELRKGIHPFSDFWRCVKGEMVNRSRVKCRVNGQAVSDIRFGIRFDRWIYEAEIWPCVRTGRNTVEIVKPTSLLEANAIPEPAMLFGTFGVRDGAILTVPERLESLRWDDGDLANYSGSIRFERRLVLPEALRGEALMLTFESVHAIAQVRVNGQDCGTRVMPPWRFEIPAELTAAELTLQVRLINTPANRWQAPRVSGAIGSVKLGRLRRA